MVFHKTRMEEQKERRREEGRKEGGASFRVARPGAFVCHSVDSHQGHRYVEGMIW